MGCKVCEHPKAAEIMQRVYDGEITYRKAAKLLQLPVPTVWNCFKNHWEVMKDGEKIRIKLKDAKSIDDYVEILKEQLNLLITRLSRVPDEFEVANERAVVALTKELRGIMRDVLEFEGKLTRGIHIQYNQLNIKFSALVSYLFSNLPDEEVQKLLEKLPELEQLAKIESK